MRGIFTLAIWIYIITFVLVRNSPRREAIREVQLRRREGFLRLLFILALPYIIAAGFLRGIVRRLRDGGQH